MKILVPSDFSQSSNNAALYAAKFAKKVNAELILFHVVYFEHPPMVQVSGLTEDKIEEARLADAAQDCLLLINDLNSKVNGVHISSKVVPGFPIADVIEEYAKSNNIDLIVMGTKGASHLQKILFGSNAVAVINKSSIPVITVPEASIFNNMQLLVYATDMSKIQSEIPKIISLAKLFDASINVLHVLPSDSKKTIDVVNIEHSLIEKSQYKKISFHIAHNDNIIEGINAFITDVNADMLAMYTHEIGFFESFFNTSFSREEAFHGTIPLLILKGRLPSKEID
ncbi:MAG: universal stress protein [Parachlamydiaceae bacterium]|nr:universal stress protein [Parachlamydiaceae bacterium]